MKLRRENRYSKYMTGDKLISIEELLTRFNEYYARGRMWGMKKEIEDLYHLNMPHTCTSKEGDMLTVVTTSVDNLAMYIIEKKEGLEKFKYRQAAREIQLREAVRRLGYDNTRKGHLNNYMKSRGQYPIPFSLVPLQRELFKIVEEDRLRAQKIKAEKAEKERQHRLKMLNLHLN